MLDTLVAAAGPELAEAVAIALALGPRDRYRDAREMGRAVSDAQHGIAPVEPGADAQAELDRVMPPRPPAYSPPEPRVPVRVEQRAGGHGRTRVLTRGGNGCAPRPPRPGPPPRQAEPLAAANSGRGSSRGRPSS